MSSGGVGFANLGFYPQNQGYKLTTGYSQYMQEQTTMRGKNHDKQKTSNRHFAIFVCEMNTRAKLRKPNDPTDMMLRTK